MSDPGKSFDKEVRQQLKRRAALVRDAEAETKALLAKALGRILGVLADQPSDYQLWSLPQLVADIGRIAAEMGDAATAQAAEAARSTWAAGRDLVTEPLAAIGAATKVAVIIPRIDARQFVAMQQFLAERIKDVSAKAAAAINGELGLVVIGAQTPFDAQVAIRGILKGSAAGRAATIVRTELLRVYSTASHQAMTAAAAAGVVLDKVWRRSSKAHPRIRHALTDGQRRGHDQPFILGMRDIPDPAPAGGIHMMYPHDPAGPAAETINCGCVMVPKVRDWATVLPDHKPFMREELVRNPTLAAIVEGRDGGGKAP